MGTISSQAVDDVAPHIAVSNAIEQYDQQSGTTYHSSIKKSKTFSELFPEVHNTLGRNSVRVTNVHSSMSSAVRDDRLSILSCGSHRPAFVTNCRLLSEGVDVPTLEFIGIIDPKSSVTELIQIIGRVMRLAGDKKIGTVLVPVIVQEETDDRFQLEYSSYKVVYNVAKALRAHHSQQRYCVVPMA